MHRVPGALRRLPFAAALAFALAGCRLATEPFELAQFEPIGAQREQVRVLLLRPGVTVTIVAPPREAFLAGRPVELVLYALPNGNTTEQTIGKRRREGVDWHFDIQHLGAQTRELRARGLGNVVVAYLEADTRSWPAWRRELGYEAANARIVRIVEEIREAIGNPPGVSVTLTGHSGGGSFVFGFIEGCESIPGWVDRIAFLDSNYNFKHEDHGGKIAAWLRGDERRRLVVLAYDDREVTLGGKKVVSETGGTWRATERMAESLRGAFRLRESRLGDFVRFSHPQIDLLAHTNPENKILHTALVGDWNGYMHAMLLGRRSYRGSEALVPRRLYEAWIEDELTLPAPTYPPIPPRREDALSGRAFIESVAELAREDREAAILHELMEGNIPDFLREPRSITVRATGIEGVEHTATYRVMPDYLAIGSNEDFVRMPMNPHTAQSFCDAFGFVLPTRKMSDDIWSAAGVKLEPRPLTQERESPRTFLQHHRIIEEQRGGRPPGELVAGIKKDVVVTNRLQERENRVAIYGWHYPTGKPIQPLTIVHVDWYVDYSHGIRPVHRIVEVDGKRLSFEEVLKDPHLHVLLSDEGEIPVARYERK